MSGAGEEPCLAAVFSNDPESNAVDKQKTNHDSKRRRSQRLRKRSGIVKKYEVPKMVVIVEAIDPGEPVFGNKFGGVAKMNGSEIGQNVKVARVIPS